MTVMKSTYILEGLEEKKSISNIVVGITNISGIQLVSYNGQENQLTIEYQDSLVDKIIVEVLNLIRKLSPKVMLKNTK